MIKIWFIITWSVLNIKQKTCRKLFITSGILWLIHLIYYWTVWGYTEQSFTRPRSSLYMENDKWRNWNVSRIELNFIVIVNLEKHSHVASSFSKFWLKFWLKYTSRSQRLSFYTCIFIYLEGSGIQKNLWKNADLPFTR